MKTLILAFLSLSLTSSLFAGQNQMQIKLRIQATDGNLDETTVYFAPNISAAYSAPSDEPKVFSEAPGVPAIYSFTSDNAPCLMNGYGDLSTTAIVDLGVIVDSSGLYNLTMFFSNNFDETSLIVLEDRQLNVFTDLRSGSYNAQINTGDMARGRFFLHVLKAIQFNTTTAGCANTNGIIALSTDNSIAWNLCQLYDSSNSVIGSYSNTTGMLTFSSLAEGDYYVVFTYNFYTITKAVHVNGNYVKVNIGSSLNNVLVGEEIDFSSAATNATKFDWSFGDGTLVTGIANPTIQYYVPGDFIVNLKCSNDSGCSANAQLNMSVSVATGINDPNAKGVSIITQAKTVIVNMNSVPFNSAELKVFNLLGQPVYTGVISNTTTLISLIGQTSGYYVIAINNAGKVTAQKVYIAN